MSLGSRLRSWARIFTRRDAVEASQLDEWQFHIDQRAADLERDGVPPARARQQARAEFGSLDARHEESRDALGLRLLDDLTADLRYALRLLREAPAFTSVAILSLALGIGANTAIFSLMESVLWRSLPVPAPEELRQVEWISGPKLVMDSTWGSETPEGGAIKSTSMPYPAFVAMQRVAGQHGTRLSAFKPIGRLTAVIDGRAELVKGELISGDFHRSMGVVPIAGRAIDPSDDQRQAETTVAVISHSFWARRFGLDHAAIGRTIRVNQVPVTIVGVNPPAFTGFTPDTVADVFLPITSQPTVLPWRYATNSSLLDEADYWWVLTMARVPPGVDERHVQTAMNLALGNHVRPLLAAKPGTDRPHVRLTPGGRGADDMRREFTRPLSVLMAFVGLVLLIACANLANLLLARATARQREIGLRLALGAGPARIARQLLTEGLLLAGLGGTGGLLLGYWLRNGIPRLMGNTWQPDVLQAAFSGRVLLLTMGVTLATGVLFSLAPIWQATRVRVTSSLRDGVRTTSGRSRRTSRRALVVLQVAVSVVLLVGAGLFVRTLWNLRSASLGFNPERLVLFTIDPPRTRYDAEARSALFVRLEEAIARIPGIESTTLSSVALVADGSWTTRATPSGRESRGVQDRTWVNDVGAGFFQTMGIPILRGRGLEPRDRAGATPAAVVNQQFVRNFYPDKDPIGQTFKTGETLYTIVGVSADARYHRVDKPMPPTFYRAYAQAQHLESMTFEVRTGVAVGTLMQSVRAAVDTIDRDLPVFDVRTQSDQIAATMSQQRLFAGLTSAFGLLALVLAAIGIYGVIAGGVAARITEIGVRMALGAERGQVLRMILREAAMLAGLGLVIGLAAASGLVRQLTDYLYELTPFDPVTAAVSVALILVVALVSGWWPARAASRLDPMQALRHE
jgi:predicted permease